MPKTQRDAEPWGTDSGENQGSKDKITAGM